MGVNGLRPELIGFARDEHTYLIAHCRSICGFNVLIFVPACVFVVFCDLIVLLIIWDHEDIPAHSTSSLLMSIN